MVRLKGWLQKNWVEVLVFTVVLLMLFWRLGTVPEVLDQNIDVGIHPQVYKVFDHLVVPGETTWLWQDLHQFEGGRSPLYGGVIELGLRLFGLTLFGIRIFTAIISFLVLILLYYTLKQYFPRAFALIFIILFSSAPWYLTLARSGGIVGFSLDLLLIALCLVGLLVKKEKKGWILPILAGVSVAMLPYGYAVIRPIIPLLVIFTILCVRKIKARGLILFLVSGLLIVSIQFIDIQGALHHFFFARGESSTAPLMDWIHDPKVDLKPVFANIKNNFAAETRILLGLNNPGHFVDSPLATALCSPDDVLYPKFLVPFFVLGFLLYLINFFRKRSMRFLAPILFFFVAVIPGTIGSAVGGPCMGRDTIELIPLYFFITYAFYQIFVFLGWLLERIHIPIKQLIVTSLLILIVSAASVYQVYNYFGWSSVRGERAIPALAMYPRVMEYFNKKPDAKILIQEFAPFGEYEAYAFIRLLGGKPFQEKVEKGQIKFVRNDNIAELNQLIQEGYFDAVFSSFMDQLLEKDPSFGLPVLAKYPVTQYDNIFVIELKNPNQQLQ